ncbi:GtrA family protein [Granulicella sp. dw_53]|uniref:GtrA family protein n=1 Tax=Granulicella sp. dw_53 TaxID=2719792 RepID=UPI001BD26BEF|nr:GtrA family protein [Granulicella sp. dw_53]
MQNAPSPVLQPEPNLAPPTGPFASLRRLLPPGEVIRYLLVGVWNTLFAYALYSGFVLLYGHFLPKHYLPLTVVIASVSAKPIGITMSFLCYKHFVFRTHGNYLREWLRCFAVYGVGMLPELIALPILTHLFLRFALTHRPAPYLAGAFITIFTATLSYFGHKKFSFRI